MQRRVFLTGLLASLASMPASAQSFSQSRAAYGVRTALSQATQLATSQLGQYDGFWGDPQVRIPLPNELALVQARLAPLGLSGLIDDVEERINRAAEQAMLETQLIVLNAVNAMTIDDAVGIVRGGDTAATDYLRRSSEPQLQSRLRPPMQDTLRDSGAYTALTRVEPYVEGGNDLLRRFGFGAVTTDDLASRVTDHAVEKTLDGVFHYIGEEERAIRRDPLGQGASIIRAVFG